MAQFSRIIFLLFGLLMSQYAFAGQGAQIELVNQYGAPIGYEFTDEQGLSSDTVIRSGTRGSIADRETKDLGYIEENKFASTTEIILRLYSEGKAKRGITLNARGGHWKYDDLRNWLGDPRVDVKIATGDQDHITVIIRPRSNRDFSLNSWMGDLVAKNPDWKTRRVADFAILGTHDSAANDYWAPVAARYVRTQNQSIFDQLNNGVRFLDFRLGRKVESKFDETGRIFYEDSVEMVHSSFYLGISFKQAVDQVNDFLEKNPDEFVLLSVKIDDGDHDRIRTWLKRNIKKEFLNKLYAESEIASDSRADDDWKSPTYEQVKGKILILDRGVEALGGVKISIPDKAKYSTNEKNNAAQDAYDADSISEGEKSEAIQLFYNNCMVNVSSTHDSACDNKYRLNFISFSHAFENKTKIHVLYTPEIYSKEFNPVIFKTISEAANASGIIIIDSFDENEMAALARKVILTNFK